MENIRNHSTSEVFIMKKHFCKRVLAWFLTLCTVLGLLPAVTFFEAEAADDLSSQISSLVSSLTNSYDDLTIPVNKEVTNYTALDGVYFIRESGSGRTINFANARAQHQDRLTANTNSKIAASNYYHLDSIAATGSNGGALTAINGKTPTTLDYAVEIKKYTATITWDTTSTYTSDGTTYTGWSGYMNWEYNRTNSWSNEKKFGEYLGINGQAKTSDPVYSIKSLHSSRSSAPYVAAVSNSGSMNYTASAFPWFLKINSTNASVKIYKVDPTGKSQHTYWLGVDTSNSNYISAHTISQIVREDRNKSTADKFASCNKKGFKFEYYDIFQVSPLTLELYQALLKVKSYVTGGNSGGKYPAETYLNFLMYAQNAMTAYNNKRSTFNSDKNNADRISMDAMARDLVSYAALLDIESKPNSYMDIPMEVLDFRADGLLFEFFNSGNPYGLNSGSPAVPQYGARPGTVVKSEKNDGNDCVEGLIQPQLVNGSIRYTEATVSYIADALFWQQKTFTDPAAKVSTYMGDFGPEDMDTYYNKVFMNMIDPYTENRLSSATSVRPSNHYFSTKGTYNQTITKVNQNGGELRFNQVTTYFDLAYYMLTYMWKETPSDDIIETVTKSSKTYSLPYNMKIPELTTLRLLKNSNGKYIFSSDKANGRNLDKGLIYNHNLTTAADAAQPGFNAAANLGFESSSMLGNNTTGGVEDPAANVYGARNFHVMYHVKSAFVYYEDKNLSFSFTGDDDVYFFINDTSVCEIGGTHSPTKRSVSLNGAVAKKLGLEDGDICTFDMFLIDRHTTGINLNFETNIEMMPAGAVADKVQYLYTGAGVIGEELKEGAVVADRTEIGYGFKLLNRNEHGTVDLTFTDAELGVTISEDEVTLNGYANVNDLILIYRTYDPQNNIINGSTPQAMTFSELEPMLSKAVADMGSVLPLDDGAYMLTGLTAEQIMELMALGIPANVQVSIYGFHRTVLASVGGYTNTLVTSCRPITDKTGDAYIYADAIIGSGSKNLNVQTMNTVTAEPFQVVIDYGKPVIFTIDEIYKAVTYDPADVSLSFLGIREEGKHEAIVFREPEEVPLRNVGDTMTTEAGTYKQFTDYFRFTPDGMLDHVERVYALVGINDVYLGSIWYLTVEVRIIPANIMYYEAESLYDSGDLTFTEQFIEELTDESPEDTTEPEEGETPEEPVEGETPEEPGTEDNGVRVNHHISRQNDDEKTEHTSTTYSPKGKTNVLFFDFNTYADNSAENYYSGNTVYGGKNFGDVKNWWSPGYGSITSMKNGVITFTTTNNDNPWGYIATGEKSSSSPTGANAAQFPLQYKPADDDWLEIRLKVDKTAAQDATNTHLRVEFFPYSADTDLKRTAVTTKNFSVNDINNGFFVLKFPIATTMENKDSPCGIGYTELDLVRRINFLIRGLDKSETFTTTIDYIYIGPEATRPSNMGEKEIFIGFDNTDADHYRYNNPVYGIQLNYDKAPASTGDSWLYSESRTPNSGSTTFSVSDGALKIPTGTVGGTNSNSPYIQTGYSGNMQNVMDFPVAEAETVRVRLKFENLTTALTDTEEYMLKRGYPDYPVVRLGFVLDDDATYEDSACWVDWAVTEDQLNGCDYINFTENIVQLLKDHNAKKISAIRLTIASAAGMEGKQGYVYLDEIYVGPAEHQDSGTSVPASETVIYDTPPRTTYYPDYDKSVIFFGFDNTTTDQARYTNNSVYGGKNFDDKTNWWGPVYSKKDLTISIANGALTYSITPNNTWGYVATGKAGSDASKAEQAEFPLDYTPTSKDWCEVRLRLDDVVPSGGSSANASFAIELFNTKNSTASGTYSKFSVAFPGNKIGKGYVILAFELSDSTCSGDHLKYSKQNKIRRMNLLIGSIAQGDKYSCSIDYFYIGPKEKSPSVLAGESVYFGFENDEYSLYQYNSTTYGGTNFDQAANWRIGRIGTKSVSNGNLTFTVTKSVLNSDGTRSNGEPWLETQRGGNGTSMTMSFPTTKAKTAQIRVKFDGIDLIDPSKDVTLQVQFADAYILEPTTYTKEYTIPGSHVVTDGKWFTYAVDLAGVLPASKNITGIRLRFMNLHSVDEKGTITLDYIYVGPSLVCTAEAYGSEHTYGYDSTYALDSKYSDSEALYTEGRGVPVVGNTGHVNYDTTEQYTELGFSFTGTGFDLISRTGMQQGTIRVSVYKANDLAEDNRVKTVTVNNKGELELYQIPVVSIQGLEHDTYYVKIWVNDKITAADLPQLGIDLSYLTRGNLFYLDAIRIYDPIDVSGETLTTDQADALVAYKADKEAYQYIKEIRNILLSRDSFDTLNGSQAGMVFLDVNSANVDPETGNVNGSSSSDYTTANVQTYNKIGPKNEVYLSPGQAIAFRLLVDTTIPIGSLDIGAKLITPDSKGALSIGFVEGTDTVIGKTTRTVQSGTARYYTMDTSKISDLTAGSTEELYLIISNESTGNSTENVISITDIKVAYEAQPTVVLPEDQITDTEIHKKDASTYAPVRFMVDADILTAVTNFALALPETPIDGETDSDPTQGGTLIPIPRPETAPVVENIKILHSLNLASDISINYVVAKASLEGYENFYLLCTLPVYEGNILVGTKELTLAPELKGEYYYFTLTGLTAVHMNDEVEAYLSLTENGTEYRSGTDLYSIARYAYGQLAKSGISRSLQVLCAELLRYGGAAQIYKSYRTDHLADKDLTEEHRAHLADTETVAFDSYNSITEAVEAPTVTWAGKTLLLDSKVTIRYVLDLSKYPGDPSELSIRLSYTDLNGEEVTCVLEDPTVYNEALGYYSLDFDGLLAAELRQPVYARVYCGETPMTGILEYSASTYGMGKTGALGDLCKCLMAYSDSAKAYFSN